MKLSGACAIVLVILLIAVCSARRRAPMVLIDGRMVVADLPNPHGAAKLLAGANNSVLRLLAYLRRKYSIDAPGGAPEHTNDSPAQLMLERAYALLDGYNFETVSENDPRGSGTAFTVRKGESMKLCLREKGAPYRLIGHNTLLFVLIHEVAHIAAFDVWSHAWGFWVTFKWLLNEARLAQVYVPVNYEKAPVIYCGLVIEYSPYFDSEIPLVMPPAPRG